MVGPILSVLLMGMLPVSGSLDADRILPSDLAVAPPVLTGTGADALPMRRRLSASGIVIADLDSGQTLYQRSPDEPRPMASLTKLMTALLTVENHAMDEWVTIPSDISDPDSSLGHLPRNKQFRVGDVLKALLISSSNEAAVTLAMLHGGSVSAFIPSMNARARELGLAHTSYVNPSGLDAPLQESTPREIAWLAMFVFRHPDIRSRMGEQHATIESRTGETIELSHTHLLLKPGTPVVAGKTGTTDEAKQCLLSIVQEGTHRYVVVLLRSGDRYGDMQTIDAALAASSR